MGSKQKKGGKTRRPSAISKRSKGRKVGRGPKNDPITSAAREFLYECPGGMDENEKRDKFLAAAKRDEQKGEDLYNIVGNVVRAAFFQGTAYVKEAAPVTRKGSPGKTMPRGRLKEKHLLIIRLLMRAIGSDLFKRLESQTGDPDAHDTRLLKDLKSRFDRYDYDKDDPELWNSELDWIGRDILDCILERVQEKFEVLMGASAWKTMGLPQF